MLIFCFLHHHNESLKSVTPFNQRFCLFCQTQPNANTNQTDDESNSIPIKHLDTEQHFLLVCNRFPITRESFLAKIVEIKPGFRELPVSEQFSTLMCPTTPQLAKIINRFIRFMVGKREKISSGDIFNDL